MFCMNILTKLSIKELGTAAIDTFKRKPLKSLAIVAAIVATVALTILLAISLPALAPLPIVLAITAMSLVNPGLLSFILFQDIKESLFAQFKKNHTIDKISNSDVVLVLEAKHDHNGAFQQDQRKEFREVEKKYAIAYKKVSNIVEIAESIDKVLERNNRIKAIWIRAHGNPQSMSLDKDKHLTIENVFHLKNLFRQIDPNGYIILDSCSTGGKNRNGDLNIAKKIAQLAPGRTVIASSQDTTSLSLKLGKGNPLNVKMWTEIPASKNCFLKYPSKVFNLIKYMFFTLANGRGIFNKLAFDATQVYRAPA